MGKPPCATCQHFNDIIGGWQTQDGSGAYYDGHGDVCQCQWCYEASDYRGNPVEVKNG